MSKKPSRLTVAKQFRLIDFHTYDESPASSGSSDELSDSAPKKYKAFDDKQFVIQMFGINEQGETCCLFVRDYQPFFYIKVDNTWKTKQAQELLRTIKEKIDYRYRESVVKSEIVECKKLYGFCAGNMDTFVKLTFRNNITMAKVKNLWYIFHQNPAEHNGEYKSRIPFMYKNISLELYESNIPPLLRYFHIQQISPTGWVSFRPSHATVPTNITTTCRYEYNCPMSELKPLPNKETPVPYKICSFDIEASSSHGDFPVPVKTYKRLVANIVDAYIRQNMGSPLDKSTCQQLCRKVILTAFGYDHFDDVDVVYPRVMSLCSKERIISLIKILLEEPVEKAKCANETEDNSYILTIDNVFETIKEVSAQSSQTQEDDEAADQEEPVFAVQEEITTRRSATNNNNSLLKKVNKKSTILDILMSDKYERDDKIQVINDVMTRLFPRLKGDEVTFIGSTFMKYGDAEPYLNHCLVVGSCDPVQGATIVSVDEEADLLTKWTELIQEENPDIIIGYNIFGFDYEFMFRRAQETGCETEFLKLSRRQDEVCAKPISRDDDELMIENAKLAVASGEYDLRYPKMIGRLQIDMLFTFRRDFSLSSHKLDDVACQFICDDIKKIELITIDGNPITELYSKNMTGLHVDDFIHIELSGFSSDYYNHGEKFRVLAIEPREVTETIKGKEQTNKYNIIQIAGHHPIDMKCSPKWGTAKDDVTPQDIFRLSKGSSTDRAVVAKYCIQDCNLVQHLMNKVDVITGHVEMGKICSVPISFLVFRGQGIKLTSFVAKKCRDMNTLMPDLEKVSDADGYEGAIVLPPKCSMYMDNPVACVDYSSLYPSSMISQNLSHDSKVWTKEFDLEGNLLRVIGEQDAEGKFIYDNLPDYDYIDLEFDTYKYIRKTKTSKAEKTKSGRMICRWAQFPDAKKGIMPTILEELLKARKDTRALIKTEKDPFMQNILDKRQLGYKVTANSLYGQCGSRTSTFYEKDIAASTTATGRMMITYARRMIEEIYGDRIYTTVVHGDVKCRAEYIYGDTDSVFFTFNLEDPITGEKIRGKPALEATIEIAQDAAQLCTQYLKAPMELSYEKTLMPFILVRKKKYVGMLYETDANKGKMKIMGLSVKRRDTCDYFKDVYGGVLNRLMAPGGSPIQDAMTFVNDSLQQLIKGEVPMEKLSITKALRSYYKNPQTIAHKVLADRIGKRDPGNKPKAGDRIKYVCIEVPNSKKTLMGDRIETPEFIKEQNIKIDYNYYITNQLMKPLQQLFGLCLEQIWEIDKKKNAGRLKNYRTEIERLRMETPEIEKFIEKKERVSSAKIKTILFDKCLQEIDNEKNHIQSITNFFSKG